MEEVPPLSSACNRAGKTCEAAAEELSLAEFLLSTFSARAAEGHNYFCHIWAACVALAREEVSLFRNNFASQSHSTFSERKCDRNMWMPEAIVVQILKSVDHRLSQQVFPTLFFFVTGCISLTGWSPTALLIIILVGQTRHIRMQC